VMATARTTVRVRTRTWHPASESAARRYQKSKRRRRGPRWACRSRMMRERCDARNRRVQCTYGSISLVDLSWCVRCIQCHRTSVFIQRSQTGVCFVVSPLMVRTRCAPRFSPLFSDDVFAWYGSSRDTVL
jgi:hypothetical protein